MGKKKRAGKQKHLLLLCILIMIAGAVVYIATTEPPKGPPRARHEAPVPKKHHPVVPKQHHEVAPPIAREEPRTVIPQRPTVAPTAPVKRKLAIIIDDLGQDQAILKELLQLGIPMTVAVLPHCPHSREAAQMAHQAGVDVLLHLPMEPHGYPERNPGPGALLTVMNEQALTAELERDLDDVPYVKGVNNHMGSLFMEDEGRLEIVFRALRHRNLFFVDSRTTANTQASESARKTGLSFLSRDVFLDNGGDPDATYKVLLSAVEGKPKSGHTVGTILIGHPYPGTVAALRRMVREMPRDRVEFVVISKLR